MDYPEAQAVKTWEQDGVTFSLVRHDRMGHYCGYARFPMRPVRGQGYDGFLTYVPVHGGITYCESGKDNSVVYGFDCAHAGDDNNPNLRDEVWLAAECHRMAKAITLAAHFEGAYLAQATNKGKARIIDNYHGALRLSGIEFCLTDNFGSMLKVLSGSL